MSEIVQSWPWFDRLIFGGLIAMLFMTAAIVAKISEKLDRIIRLLEIGNDINDQRRR